MKTTAQLRAIVPNFGGLVRGLSWDKHGADRSAPEVSKNGKYDV